ncbi:MAG: tRNA epoxyqueuosine(34) reductase QueG [Candidatus Eisenbacteria bacterium]
MRSAIPGNGELRIIPAATASPSGLIRGRALELGFEAAGIARVEPLESARHYEAWVGAGMHGGMDWLASEAQRSRRADPARILRGVASVVCVALHHDPAGDPARDARLGRIARYAAGDDYHALMKEKLSALARYVLEVALPGSRALWYSDTGAILERGWAQRAGLGWTGKHSGLLSTSRGSWFLLGELLVDRVLEADPAQTKEHCGSCTRCLDVCPTRAIVAPYQVDARRCISYLTIEHRGVIPRELRPLIGEWIFGCDLCQEVCPWNRFAPPAREARLMARPLEGWSLERFLSLDESAFATLFAGSPVRRTGRDGFLRNVCVALGNRGDAAAAPALERVLGADPGWLVRAHAAWALGELAARSASSSASAGRALREARAFDLSSAVRGEAAAALQRLTESSDNFAA